MSERSQLGAWFIGSPRWTTALMSKTKIETQGVKRGSRRGHFGEGGRELCGPDNVLCIHVLFPCLARQSLSTPVSRFSPPGFIGCKTSLFWGRGLQSRETNLCGFWDRNNGTTYCPQCALTFLPPSAGWSSAVCLSWQWGQEQEWQRSWPGPCLAKHPPLKRPALSLPNPALLGCKRRCRLLSKFSCLCTLVLPRLTVAGELQRKKQ